MRKRYTHHIRGLTAALLPGLMGLISTAAFASGTIAGKVTATPSKYLPETVVYVQNAQGNWPKKSVTMDQKDMKFFPHVLAITVGDTVTFENHDPVEHNVSSPEGGYDLGIFRSGDTRSHAFDKPGAFSQLCRLHPEMLAYVFVGQNPYQVVVDEQGNYKIPNVPAGTYQLTLWNSHLKAPVQSITVTDGKTVEANFSLQR